MCCALFFFWADERPTEFLPARHECDVYICTELRTCRTNSFQNVKCEVYIRKELRATFAMSGDYGIGLKIEGSFKGCVIELFQLNYRSASYTVFFGVPGDYSPGTKAGYCSQTSLCGV